MKRPTLFISYKRSTAVVNHLTKELRKAKFNLWIDYSDLKSGAKDWQLEIDKGIEQSDALILCLTENAINSDYVKYEVEKAFKQEIPILPVLFEKIKELKTSLISFGLNDRHQVHNEFLVSDSDSWNRGVTKLVEDLAYHDIVAISNRVTNISKRQRAFYQPYLSFLYETVGFIDLKRINPKTNDFPLQEIYVPLPTNLKLSIKIKDYKIIDWWIGSKLENYENISEDEAPKSFTEMIINSEVVDSLVERIQDIIDGKNSSDNIDERNRPLILAPLWADQIKEDFWPLTCENIAASLDRLVLLGKPGTGKSTFAHHLTLSLIGNQLDPPLFDSTLPSLGPWPHGFLTPIYIRLREFVHWKGFPALSKQLHVEHLEDYLKQCMLSANLKDSSNLLISDLHAGRAIIIFDGLDEIPVPVKPDNALELRRKQLKGFARSLNLRYRNSRIVFTSRDYAYKEWNLDSFYAVKIAPLKYLKMKKIVKNIFSVSEKKEGEAISIADKFLDNLNRVDIPTSLFDRSLFLSLMATIFLIGDKDSLPTCNGELYHESIKLLLDTWTQSKLNEGLCLTDVVCCTAADLFRRLENIAFKAFEQTTDAESEDVPISRSLILDELFELSREVNIREALDYISNKAGILMEISPNIYQFSHRVFQEYLAASYMVREDQHRFDLVCKSIEEQPLIWSSSCLLTGEVLKNSNRFDLIWNLVEDLLGVSEPSILPKSDKHWWRIWLAGNVFIQQSLHTLNYRESSRVVLKRLQNWLHVLFQIPDVHTPVLRAEVGIILGQIGDTREGVSLNADNIPDIHWCKIPAGEFLMGSHKDQINIIQKEKWAKGWGLSRETPGKKHYLPEYYISRYPITQIQFKAFVDDNEGYQNPKWWKEHGSAWFKVSDKPNVEYPWGKLPNIPATNVNWYEAMAFCEWLAYKIKETIRLPTEAEWEKAARGTDARVFPWGNKFDSTLCNSMDTEIGTPSAVGCFLIPNPAWEDNPLDMSGNVWEWTTTICEQDDGNVIPYPYEEDHRENTNLGEKYLRVVRGGAYLNPPFLVRTAFRGRDKPSSQFSRQGFRVVKIP